MIPNDLETMNKYFLECITMDLAQCILIETPYLPPDVSFELIQGSRDWVSVDPWLQVPLEEDIAWVEVWGVRAAGTDFKPVWNHSSLKRLL